MPGVLRTGMGSPVRSASLILDEPVMTIPSTGINSPGFSKNGDKIDAKLPMDDMLQRIP